MKALIISLLILLSTSLGVLLYLKKTIINTSSEPEGEVAVVSSDCIPTFKDGGGPYYQPNTPFRENIAPKNNSGEKLIISGKVLKNGCTTPLSNAVVDIWQANETGNYDDSWYRGRVKTNDKGEYTFTTVVPKGYGEGSGFRPPHIHFKIWEGSNELITSQMFLPASRAQGIEEAYIIKIESIEENGTKIHYGTHDIIL